jgi:hypothetical protein
MGIYANAAISQTTENMESKQRDYFRDRARSIKYTLLSQAERAFGICTDEPPRTAKEMVERIKAGMYVLPSDDDDWGRQSIQWRDPSIKRDRDGFRAAAKKIDDEYQSIKDKIMAQSITELPTLMETWAAFSA